MLLRITKWISAGVLLILSWAGWAAVLGAPLEVEQILRLRSISDIQTSPDGHRFAFTVTEPVQGTESGSNVWIYNAASGNLLQLTTSPKGDWHPRWSPDGTRLAFLSKRTESTQVHLISVDGGEAVVLTDSQSDVTAFEWSPVGSRIAFLATEPKSKERKQREETKDDRQVAGEDSPARVWIQEISGGPAQQLTSGMWRIAEFEWIPPAGDKLILAATDNDVVELPTKRVFTLDVASRELVAIAAPANPFSGMTPSPDGAFIAFLGTRGDGPIAEDLMILGLGEGESRNLTASSLDRTILSFQWKDSQTLLYQAADGFSTHVGEVTLNGEASRMFPENIQPEGAFAWGRDRLVFVGESGIQAPEVWVREGRQASRQVTRFNAAWGAQELAEPTLLRFPSRDGREIEAALLKSIDWTPEKGLAPLVVLVHGGPSGRWSSSVSDWGQLLATRGFMVLLPNIRGSIGYGREFLIANRNDWGGADFQDVMAGVDFLVAEGWADPDRLGIGGWSYGGYMAAWAVTQTDRFKASVSGAPMTDLAFEYGSETPSINAYDTWYMGTPYENLDLFVKRSPVTFVRKVTTPTLLLCGEQDVIDPVEQCGQFHRGLRRYGVRTSYVVYPREGHGIREEKHQIDLLNRVVRWFEEHLR